MENTNYIGKSNYIKFIDKIVIFVVVIFILLMVINFTYVELILNKKNVYRNHEQFLEAGELKVLVFGDSLPVHDINPVYIDGSFNLATPGESMEQTYYKVKWALENEPSVEVYVLEYSYHLFNYHRIKPYYDVSYWKNYMSFGELSMLTNQSTASLFFQDKFPVIGKGEEIIKYYTDPRSPTVIENGWFRDDTNFLEDREDPAAVGSTRMHNQFGNLPAVLEEELVEEFFDIIELVVAANKTVVLVKYPLTNSYITPLLNESNLYEDYKGVDDRINVFDGVVVLDYFESYRHNESMFIDSDHLSTAGSEIFSKEISKFINKY